MKLAAFRLPGRVALLVALTTGSAALAQQAHGGYGGASSPRSGWVSRPGAVGNKPGAARPLPPPAAHPQHGRTVLVPYPVYYGGYYYGDAGNRYAQQPAPAYDYGLADASAGQPPVAIVNPGYRPDTANPVMRDYSNDSLPPPGPDYQEPDYRANDKPTIYLLAMSDHTIIPAIAYWVDGDTLSYITTEGSQNRVSLSLIDREFSRQLNDSRNVEFKLPAAK